MKKFLLLLMLSAVPAGAQTYSLSPLPKVQVFDSAGAPLASGKVNTYEAGTTTPATTYTSADGMTANANPVILDSSGRASIYLVDGTCYKFAVTDSADDPVFTQDNICAPAGASADPGFDSVTVGDADGVTINGVIAPQALEISFHSQTASSPADHVDRTFFIANQAYQVTAIRFVHATANGATLYAQVTKDTSTEAPGAGVDLLTNNSNSGFDCNATANTVQTGTLTATTANLQLAAGDRLSVDFSTSATSLVGVTITVTLKRI